MATVPSREADHGLDEWTKPPFLRRVWIRGYKSIAFCDVELHPLTILVGRNASGKSNFLDALAFLRDVIHLGVNEAVYRHGGQDSIPCRFQSEPRVFIGVETAFIDMDEQWDVTYELEIELPKDQPAYIAHEQFRMRECGDKSVDGFTNNDGIITSEGEDNQPMGEWKRSDRAYLREFALTRKIPREFTNRLESLTTYNFHPETIRSPKHSTSGILLARDGSNLASVIRTTRAGSEEAFERVGLYLAAITESVSLVGEVKYGEYETIRFRVDRKGQGPPLEFDAAHMSDGTLRALAALVAAFQFVPPYRHPSLVAIEEPETSLHPAAMRALVDALDEATQHTQVLLTTHSADLLDDPELTPSQVLVVRSRDGATQITPVDPASREIIRRELSTLADLQRQDHLDLDQADLERQAAMQVRNGEP
jgi:predicted ATPase